MRVETIKCDRCKAVIDGDPAAWRQIGIPLGTQHDPASGKREEYVELIDLCYACCRAVLAKLLDARSGDFNRLLWNDICRSIAANYKGCEQCERS